MIYSGSRAENGIQRRRKRGKPLITDPTRKDSIYRDDRQAEWEHGDTVDVLHEDYSKFGDRMQTVHHMVDEYCDRRFPMDTKSIGRVSIDDVEWLISLDVQL